MKKVLSLIAATALIAAATTAGAASILGSKHDLSSGGGSFKSNTGEVCIFCHTPHNAVQNVPLWNRNNGNAANTFKLYSSGTMNNTYISGGQGGASTGFTSNSISLFCMSCHDGSQLNNVKNQPGDVATITMNAGQATLGALPANLGTNLTSTHPVNFNLTNGADPAIYSVTNGKIGNGLTNKLPLYNSARGPQSLECASCHAVHDPANTPFLRTSNSGSKLCLACHIK